jgi:hypothetical protein
LTVAQDLFRLGIQQPQQKDNQQSANKNIELSDAQYDTDRMQMFIFNAYDTLNQLISMYFSKFKYEFFVVELVDLDIVYKFGDSLFSSFTTIPDFRIRLQIRYILKSLIESCTEDIFCYQNSLVLKLVEVLVEYFLPTILQNINEKNKTYLKLNEDSNDAVVTDANANKKIEEQVISENQFTLLCRDLCDIVKCFYHSHTGTVATPRLTEDTDDMNIILDTEQDELTSNSTNKSVPSGPSTLSDLAIFLFSKNPTIYQSFLLILFEGNFCFTLEWLMTLCAPTHSGAV